MAIAEDSVVTAAGVVACVVGLLTIRVLLAVAVRVNFAPFVIGTGVLVIVGAACYTITA